MLLLARTRTTSAHSRLLAQCHMLVLRSLQHFRTTVSLPSLGGPQNGRTVADTLTCHTVSLLQMLCDICTMSNQLILPIRDGINDGHHGNQRK